MFTSALKTILCYQPGKKVWQTVYAKIFKTKVHSVIIVLILSSLTFIKCIIPTRVFTNIYSNNVETKKIKAQNCCTLSSIDAVCRVKLTTLTHPTWARICYPSYQRFTKIIAIILHKVGYSLSYEEIKLFEIIAAISQGIMTVRQ